MAKKEKGDIAKKKLVTPTFRVSFPAVFEPKGFEGQEPKFSVTMIFPENLDLDKPAGGQSVSIKSAARYAALEFFGPKDEWPKKVKENFKWPWRDGDDFPELDGYKNSVFVRAVSKTKPGLYLPNLEPIIDPEDFYAGCYAKAQIIAFGYEKAGKVGVSFALQMIQKVKDGDPFTGRDRPQDAFTPIVDEENTDQSDDDWDEAPKAKSSTKKKPVVVEDDWDEAPKAKSSTKKKPAYDDVEF
jgi:hypothetical protein